jgi:hypothetical protein
MGESLREIMEIDRKSAWPRRKVNNPDSAQNKTPEAAKAAPGADVFQSDRA